MLGELLGTLMVGGVLVVGAVVLVPLLVFALIYNNLVSKRNRVENAFATVDVMLKKRYDLIPNLVSTVQGYMEHERAVFKEVTELRAKAVSGNLSSNEKVEVDNQITAALRSIMVSVENYPELKANENFLNLQTTLTELEEQISAARRAYNASVLEYNNAVEMLPTSIVASILRYPRKTFFEASEAEKSMPKAGFGDRR